MPRPKPAEPTVQLAVRIPRSLHRRVKVYAAQTGTPMVTLVTDALTALLKTRRAP
jgi:predicted HicB family RNase H-like nuclease